MPCGLTEVAAVREPGGICSDAYEAPTSPRSPNFAEESLIAAPLPQTKDSGTDSPALLHYDSFQLRLSTCQALNHYTDIAKSLHRRLHYLTPNYFSVLAKLWRKMEKGLAFLYRIGYHMYYSIISQYF